MVPIMLTQPHAEGTQFTIALEEGWLEANRGKLVSACLTLVLNYVEGTRLELDATGEVVHHRPHETKLRRSFSAWSRVMGGILKAAGIDGFLGNLDEWESKVAVEMQDDSGFLRQWFEANGDPHYSKDLPLYFAANNISLPYTLQGLTHEQLVKRLHMWLREHSAPLGGYQLVKHGSDSPHKWSVAAL